MADRDTNPTGSTEVAAVRNAAIAKASAETAEESTLMKVKKPQNVQPTALKVDRLASYPTLSPYAKANSDKHSHRRLARTASTDISDEYETLQISAKPDLIKSDQNMQPLLDDGKHRGNTSGHQGRDSTKYNTIQYFYFIHISQLILSYIKIQIDSFFTCMEKRDKKKAKYIGVFRNV